MNTRYLSNLALVAVCYLNLAITARGGIWSIAPWTDDASTGIVAGQTA